MTSEWNFPHVILKPLSRAVKYEVHYICRYLEIFSGRPVTHKNLQCLHQVIATRTKNERWIQLSKTLQKSVSKVLLPGFMHSQFTDQFVSLDICLPLLSLGAYDHPSTSGKRQFNLSVRRTIHIIYESRKTQFIENKITKCTFHCKKYMERDINVKILIIE